MPSKKNTNSFRTYTVPLECRFRNIVSFYIVFCLWKTIAKFITSFNSFYYKSLSLSCFLGSSPPCRWIVNFDFDFMDGLVLAALVSAHVPFVVRFVLQFLFLSTGYSNTNCLPKLFFIQMCDEWNEKICCFKNPCASGWPQ